MAEKFDEFLEEVEKDIRQEKFLKLWKQYGKQVIGVFGAIIIFIIGYNLWGQYQHNKQIQLAEKLITAQEFIANGENDKAQTILTNLSQSSSSTYEFLGLFQKAGLFLQQNSKEKSADAIALYNQLSANTKIEPMWRDLAKLLAIMASMDLSDVKIEELLKQLEPLTNDKNPWRFIAKEMQGVLLYRKGDSAKSMELFIRLVQDSQTPAGVSMRARLMVQIVSSSTPETNS